MKFLIYMTFVIGMYIKVFHPGEVMKEVIIINNIKQVQEDKEIPVAVKTTQSLENLGFRFAEVVLAQLYHETDKLSSNIYNYCHNLFGMKYNERGYAIGVCREHAQYKNKYDSILDYLEYQKKYLPFYENKIIHRSCLTNEDYHGFLLWIGYAEDTKYIDKILPYEKRIEELSKINH